MSTREYVYNLIDGLNEEQLTALAEFISNFTLIKVNSPNKATLTAIDDVENGRNLSKPFTSVKELMEDLNADD